MTNMHAFAVFSLVVEFLVCVVAPAHAGEATVPADGSLSIIEYVDLGVPEPQEKWTVGDYQRALRALDRLPRIKLPRTGSERSQLLFDRLLESYARAFELEYEQSAKDPGLSNLPPSLPAIYSTGRGDDLLFDREIVAIRAKGLSRSLGFLPDRAQLLKIASESIQRIVATTSNSERATLNARVQSAERAAAGISAQIKKQTSEFLAILGVPEIENDARDDFLEMSRELFPRLPVYLTVDDLEWILTLTRAAASTDFNETIRSGLLELVGQLEDASAEM